MEYYSWLKFIIAYMPKISEELNGRVNLVNYKRLKNLCDVYKHYGKTKRYYYLDLYDNCDLSLNFEDLKGLAFYEFNISGFVYCIVRVNSSFFVFSLRNNVIKFIDQEYRFDSDGVTSSQFFSNQKMNEGILDFIESVNSFTNDFFIKSVETIIDDLSRNSSFVFKFVDDTGVDDDFFNQSVGGKTGLLISEKVKSNSYYGSLARYKFLMDWFH